MKKLILFIAIALMGISNLSAQIVEPVKWSFAAKRGTGGMATVFLKATIEAPWHIYSVNQKPGGPQKTTFAFAKSPAYSLVGKVSEPKPINRYEEVFGIDVSYFEKSVVFSQKIKLSGKQATVKGKLSYMACNEGSCLPPEEISFEVPIK